MFAPSPPFAMLKKTTKFGLINCERNGGFFCNIERGEG